MEEGKNIPDVELDEDDYDDEDEEYTYSASEEITSVLKAEAAAQVAKTEADAKAYAGQKEAEANAALEKSITQELLDYYYILQWNGKLPDTYVGSDDVSTIVNGAAGD